MYKLKLIPLHLLLSLESCVKGAHLRFESSIVSLATQVVCKLHRPETHLRSFSHLHCSGATWESLAGCFRGDGGLDQLSLVLVGCSIEH